MKRLVPLVFLAGCGHGGPLDLSAGGDITCARMADGEVLCAGQLDTSGSGYVGSGMPPTALHGLAGSRVQQVVPTDRGIFVLGGRGEVAVSTNNSTWELVPAYEGGSLDGGGRIAIGADVAVLRLGRVLEMGYLASNGVSFHDTTIVDGLEHVLKVYAAGTRRCAILDTGSVTCWNTEFMYLGGRTHAPALTPVQGLSPVVDLALNEHNTCAVSRVGSLLCWGSNSYGECGVGNSRQVDQPTTVPINTSGGITAVAMGERHTCALDSLGQVFCWGSNATGQLGDGTSVARVSPVQVHLPTTIRQVVAGTAHSCGLAQNGAVYCWGSNNAGQFGAVDDLSAIVTTPTLAQF